MTESNENQLAVLVKDSGLDQTKAQVLLTKFQGFFEIAASYEAEAKSITITDETCFTDQGKLNMVRAREGRLFLRDRRIEVENVRKELKEASLREGQVIDGIAKVLKALIIPLEDHLSKQEHYLELKAAAETERTMREMKEKAEADQLEREREAESARIAEEKRIRDENERLRGEAEKREKEMKKQRAASEKKAHDAEEKARKEREAAEAEMQAEREKQDKILADERAKADGERREAVRLAEAERIRQESLREQEAVRVRKEQEKERAAAEKAAKEAAEERARLLKVIESPIECPHCHKSFKI